MFWIILSALLPVAILLFYIFRKDRQSPEPAGQLFKAFGWGLLSVPLSLCMSIPFGWAGLYPPEIHSFGGSIATAFFGAAIPEELAKLFVLWRFLRMNPYFDERMDGIVYAVCVSMGFAALENLMYVFQNSEDFLSVAIPRALFSIPGHFCFGVLMGYYFSLVRFCPAGRPRNVVLVVAAPILAHGLYDSILFVMDVSPALSGALMLVFLFFCFKLWKFGTRKIAEHLNDDANPNNTI